jgi:hypothetical protein
MTVQRVQCSAAPRWRDRHQAADRQYHLTTPEGRQYVFCSACCLLMYAVYGLPADLEARDDYDLEPLAGNEVAA